MQRLRGGHAVLRNANNGAAHNVDDSHHHTGDTVALDELHGAVHGAVHLAFLTDTAPAALCLFHVNDARAHIRIDGHLFARHGVQCEARPDLGHAFGALGNDEKLHNGQNQEDNRAYYEIAAQGEFPESEDNLAGIGLKQDQPGCGDIQTDPEERGEKQHGGKYRKVQRGFDVHRHHQHQKRKRHVHADERIHQRRWQRHDHQGDDHHQQKHHGDIVVTGESLGGRTYFSKKIHKDTQSWEIFPFTPSCP